MTIHIGIVAVKGGAGSGNWGHSGRPGMVGGSSSAAGGIAGRASVGTHLGAEVYKVSSSEVTSDKIDEWFERPGNEQSGLLFEAFWMWKPKYILLGREMKGQAEPGKVFRYTKLSFGGSPDMHRSFPSAKAAMEDLNTRVDEGWVTNMKLVGGVWLQGKKAFAGTSILLRLIDCGMTCTGMIAVKGGAGSGNWGHAGRPGLVGGSGGVGGMSLGGAVGLYSATSPINISLREGRTLEPVEKGIVAALDAGMEPLDRDTLLYRGIRPIKSPEASEAIYGVADRFGIGHEWRDMAYSSTSTDYTAASKIAGGGTVWRIHAKVGQSALRLGPLSSDVGERETLLPRGTKFRLTGRSYDDRHDVAVLDVEIVQ